MAKPRPPEGGTLVPAPLQTAIGKKARELTDGIRSAMSSVDRLLTNVEGFADELGELGVPPEQETTVAALDGPLLKDAEAWLDRQRVLGLITPEGAAAVERLIEDLR